MIPFLWFLDSPQKQPAQVHSAAVSGSDMGGITCKRSVYPLGLTWPPGVCKGARTGIHISPSGSDRNWNHFDVRAHLVPILASSGQHNWNHLDATSRLVPILAFSGQHNWNHSDVTSRLVPILASSGHQNWNHSDVTSRLVPIHAFPVSKIGTIRMSRAVWFQFLHYCI